MKTLNLIPGTPEWLHHRAHHFNASDAPAMMGASPHKTRAQLLRELHVGMARDVSSFVQERVYDPGHQFEALARPLADDILGDMLFPIVGVLEGTLYSASFDGITVDNTPHWEHKRLNDALRAVLPATGVGGPEVGAALHPMYRIQMEHQCMVSGGERVLFTASEWDGERLVEARHCWYHADAELRADIIGGWQQFRADLAAYVLPEAAPAAPAGKAPETLPALRIEVTGQVTASNLAEFKETALAAIRSVNRELRTDQDFADAEKAVKWCDDVETRLKAAKEHALSQTASIDALFKTIDDISAEARRVRLDLDKLVTRRKTEIREHAIVAARQALDMHIAVVNAEIAPMRIQQVVADFAGAIKGKRSVASMQDALDTTLAAAKIVADTQGRAIRENLHTFKIEADTFEFLFADLGQLVHKPRDDFRTLVQARINTHKANEERKAREKAEAEARASEQRRQAEEAAARAAAEAAAKAAAPGPIVVTATQTGVAATDGERTVQLVRGDTVAPANAPAPRADEPATLTLGAICERLQFTVRAEFVADVLHVKPAAMPVKGRGLYTETQFRTICRQLVSHVGAMAELYAGETA